MFDRSLPALSPRPRSWRPDFRSLVIGAVLVGIPLGAQNAGAIDFFAVANAASKLAGIKKNLDGDVKALTGDAKTLIGDKDQLFQIKDQLIKLSTDTKAQIDSISVLVGGVEGHLKTAQTDIANTSSHVQEIDAVKKSISN